MAKLQVTSEMLARLGQPKPVDVIKKLVPITKQPEAPPVIVESALTVNSNRRKSGRVPSCGCGTCNKCKHRAWQFKWRSRQQLNSKETVINS